MLIHFVFKSVSQFYSLIFKLASGFHSSSQQHDENNDEMPQYNFSFYERNKGLTLLFLHLCSFTTGVHI